MPGGETGGGSVDLFIDRSELDYVAQFFARLGTDAKVEEPQEIVERIRRHAEGLLDHYRPLSKKPSPERFGHFMLMNAVIRMILPPRIIPDDLTAGALEISQIISYSTFAERKWR